MDKKNINNVTLGKDVKIFDFVNLYGCFIDDNSKVGTFVEIQKNSIIGKNCKISSHTFICEGVEIEDDVFIGHNVTFINDKYPRATNTDGTMQSEKDWKVVKRCYCRIISNNFMWGNSRGECCYWSWLSSY